MKKIFLMTLAVIMMLGTLVLFHIWHDSTNPNVATLLKWLTMVSIVAASWAFSIPLNPEEKEKAWWKPNPCNLSLAAILTGLGMGIITLITGAITHASPIMALAAKSSTWGTICIILMLSGLALIILSLKNRWRYKLFDASAGAFLIILGLWLRSSLKLYPTFPADIMNNLAIAGGAAFILAIIGLIIINKKPTK